MSALEALRARVVAEGPPLAQGLVADSTAVVVFDDLARAGQRSRARPDAYALALESALEGYLVHYGHGRLLSPRDGDMRLLAGDYLYALGFLELARIGDVEAIEDLAELIAVCAELHSQADDPDLALIETVWALSALAIADGRWAQFEAARTQLSQASAAAEQVSAPALDRAKQASLTLEMEAALIAFRVAATARLRDT